MAERRPAKGQKKPNARSKGGKQHRAKRSGDSPGAASRRVAIEALVRIDGGGAYANLLLPEVLERSGLADADRRFVTELVYGTTRMRRACDHLVDRFLLNEVEPSVRAALRVGAYQLAFLNTPPHAALDATVGAVSGRGKSVVNAVLRRVAGAPVDYPSQGIELSYPDWVIERLTADLGAETAVAALEAMNQAAVTNRRDDGYVQDRASQHVVEAMGVEPGQLVVDLCAAPGGKATALAALGATVVAADRRAGRVRLTAANVARLGADLPLLIADGVAPPVRPGSVDHVLIDAPCSGLGTLRRRADARWRIDPDAPERLARLQVDMVLAGFLLLRPGGLLTYSVCTLTAAESSGVLQAVLAGQPDAIPAPLAQATGGVAPETVSSETVSSETVDSETADPEAAAWRSWNGVLLLVPGETDGMTLFQLRKPGITPSTG